VVLDEADEMLDLGFREDLEALLDATPAERRTLLFSATLPPRRSRRWPSATSATRCASPPPTSARAHGDIDYQAMLIPPRERELAVVNVLRFIDAGGALVFCATRDGVTHLHANLNERGFAVVALSGELSQAERTRALQSLRDGRARVCIATDVAARGLDLPDLGLVVHADLPQNAQVLLHRSGRTGRAGKKGTAIVLVTVPARGHATRMFATAGVRPRWDHAADRRADPRRRRRAPDRRDRRAGRRGQRRREGRRRGPGRRAHGPRAGDGPHPLAPGPTAGARGAVDHRPAVGQDQGPARAQ
jgi:ATP-dependent RNA helicase DeaD